jgi:hypothetical protein
VKVSSVESIAAGLSFNALPFQSLRLNGMADDPMHLAKNTPKMPILKMPLPEAQWIREGTRNA